MDHFLRTPLQCPSQYSAEFNPMHRVVGVYGHKLSTKAQAIVAYCVANSLPYQKFVLPTDEPASSGITYMFGEVAQTRRNNPSESIGTLICIIEHADVLAFEPDNEETVTFATRLERWAKQEDLLIVALLDRTRAFSAGMGANALTRHHQAFFEQFRNSSFYYPSPNSAFYKRYLIAYIDAFRARHGDRMNISLSDADHIVMAQSMASASTGHIDDFFRRVFGALMSPHPPPQCVPNEKGAPLQVGMNVFGAAPFLCNASGVAHITRSLAAIREGEDHFSAAITPTHMSSGNVLVSSAPDAAIAEEQPTAATGGTWTEPAPTAVGKKKKKKKRAHPEAGE